MERIVEQGLLYDFYGELLTEHQKYIYEAVVLNDLSLSEIAQEQGISRQGVHDMIKRCDKILAEYEEKLHLLEKFKRIRGCIRQIESIADTLTDSSRTEQIQRLTAEILLEL